ncbi:MAG: OmpA family protein, partial [Gemmatimonadales bacterium]|nr:OmpA family protein [Gemmatimonadales bacterium]
SDRLRPESTRVLTDLVEALRRADSLAVTIEGHTDAQGDDAYNLKLSERRAAAVVKYLTDQGIAANRLRSVGKGETEPVASNDTAEGRKENRRVVIRAVR